MSVELTQLGNGRWESTVFNSRLQPTQIALGVTPNATNLLDLDFTYGTTANNGNVLTQTVAVPTVGANTGFSAVQTYNYDSLNRLKDATENLTPIGGSATETWKQAFTYDRYGNRNFDEANTNFGGFDKLCNSNTELCAELRKKMNPSVNTANNRLNTSDDYAFDVSGNTTSDPDDRTFIYDAENKQVKVLDSEEESIGEYSYDGDGKRIKKYVPNTGETTIFVYDAAGKLVAEYSTIVATTENAKVAYLTNDHLGSPRINTDQNGNVTARHDYHPFGEEITTSQRTGHAEYGDDTVRKQFTGYERDNETNLDFAEARYNNFSVGRFNSPDPYNVIFEKERGKDEDERSQIFIGFVSNPQRWNMYVYVINNPLAFTDPDGRKPKTVNVFLHMKELTDEGRKEWEAFKAEAAKKKITVNLYFYTDKTATAGKFLESIKAKDTVTIFAGHSFSDRPGFGGQKLGIEFHASAISSKEWVGKEGATHTADGVDIRNDALVVFSCDFGKAFDNITSSSGSTDGVNQAAIYFARSIVSSGSSTVASVDAGTGLKRFRLATDNADSINYRRLTPAR